MLLASIITLFHNLNELDGLDKNTYIYKDSKQAEQLGNKNGMFHVFSTGRNNSSVKQKGETILKYYNLHKKYILIFSNIQVSEYRTTFHDKKVKNIEEYTVYKFDVDNTNSDIILDFVEYFQEYYERAIKESKNKMDIERGIEEK